MSLKPGNTEGHSFSDFTFSENLEVCNYYENWVERDSKSKRIDKRKICFMYTKKSHCGSCQLFKSDLEYVIPSQFKCLEKVMNDDGRITVAEYISSSRKTKEEYSLLVLTAVSNNGGNHPDSLIVDVFPTKNNPIFCINSAGDFIFNYEEDELVIYENRMSFNFKESKRIHLHCHGLKGMFFNKDDTKLIVYYKGTADFFDFDKENLTITLAYKIRDSDGLISTICMSPDDALIVTKNTEDTIKVWSRDDSNKFQIIQRIDTSFEVVQIS